MYCGTNKTALASQRQLADAMMDLIRQKPYAQISVSELCKAAGISRQTFYTLFTSRENVMVFTLQSRYCCAPQAAHAGGAGREGLRRLCRGYSEYLLRNQGLIRLLVENHIDYLLYDTFFETLEGWENHSGWVRYETELNTPDGCVIDLGEAHEMARISVNGEELAHKLWSPYVFEIPQGTIRLCIDVCNTLCNRLDGKALPSGLMGPVRMG